MLAAIESLLKTSKPGDEFKLSFSDLQEIAGLLKEGDLIKQKYALLLTQHKSGVSLSATVL